MCLLQWGALAYLFLASCHWASRERSAQYVLYAMLLVLILPMIFSMLPTRLFMMQLGAKPIVNAYMTEFADFYNMHPKNNVSLKACGEVLTTDMTNVEAGLKSGFEMCEYFAANPGYLSMTCMATGSCGNDYSVEQAFAKDCTGAKELSDRKMLHQATTVLRTTCYRVHN